MKLSKIFKQQKIKLNKLINNKNYTVTSIMKCNLFCTNFIKTKSMYTNDINVPIKNIAKEHNKKFYVTLKNKKANLGMLHIKKFCVTLKNKKANLGMLHIKKYDDRKCYSTGNVPRKNKEENKNNNNSDNMPRENKEDENNNSDSEPFMSPITYLALGLLTGIILGMMTPRDAYNRQNEISFMLITSLFFWPIIWFFIFIECISSIL
jgi:ribosomal protein L33